MTKQVRHTADIKVAMTRRRKLRVMGVVYGLAALALFIVMGGQLYDATRDPSTSTPLKPLLTLGASERQICSFFRLGAFGLVSAGDGLRRPSASHCSLHCTWRTQGFLESFA